MIFQPSFFLHICMVKFFKIAMAEEVRNIMSDKKKEKIIKLAGFLAVPVIAFYLMEFYDRNPFEQIRPMAHLLNIMIFELIAGIVYFLTGRAKLSLRIVLVLSMIFGLVNHYVMAFRSTPFVPWDIFSINTAFSVANNYNYTPSLRLVIVTLIFAVLIFVVRYIDNKMEIKFRFRALAALLVCVMLTLLGGAIQNEDFQQNSNLYPYLFTPTVMTKYNGLAVTFTMDLAYVIVDKPSGYSVDKAEDILAQYEQTDETEDSSKNQDYPNIIVIMDEAFSDLKVLGDFETNEDYMPFVHSLMNGADNTVSGYLNVSVCGGNTADTEFEFLTGNTMAFLPSGSIPYQQYIKSETPSLARYLSSLGYAAYAQHPYYGSGWNRETVYPLLGFQNMNFVDDYIPRTIVRQYVSDESDFNMIIKTFEQKEKDKPAFIFNVTMQNHGGYSSEYDNFTNNISAVDVGNSGVDQYLSLISLTDQNLEKLIDYFKNQDEKTIVVFFGDHQPSDNVAAPVLSELGKDYTNLTEEESESRYMVPYFIWANYDIDEAQNVDTSVNYLAANMLKYAGVETSSYQNFLLELENYYPVISAARTEENMDTDESLREEMLYKYKCLEYYNLFDWEDK